MSQPKHTAILRGDVLQDMATGQLFKLHPSEEEMQRGVWEYNSEADGHWAPMLYFDSREQNLA